MYTRSTTIQAQPESIDAGIEYVRAAVMPALTGIEGWIGLSLLVDRQSGRCIATSSWQTDEAMRASEQAIRPVREQAAQVFCGSLLVEAWEIAVLHRDHPSCPDAGVRTTWFQIDPAQLERAIDVYKVGVLPTVEDLPGFCSASMLVNRTSGRCVSSVAYDSVDAMQRIRERAKTIRAAAARDTGMSVLDVCEFELALAHLRVPEMV